MPPSSTRNPRQLLRSLRSPRFLLTRKLPRVTLTTKTRKTRSSHEEDQFRYSFCALGGLGGSSGRRREKMFSAVLAISAVPAAWRRKMFSAVSAVPSGRRRDKTSPRSLRSPWFLLRGVEKNVLCGLCDLCGSFFWLHLPMQNFEKICASN